MIESLFINRADQLHHLFAGLRFIIIDEVHSFLETDRGIQLRSQLERLSAYTRLGRPRRIGLSATVGDLGVAKTWLNPKDPNSVVLIDPGGVTVATRFSHMHFSVDEEGIPVELIDDLYALTRNRKALIFCNRREDVEKVTVQLNRRCARDRTDEHYFPHHGSINKEIREEAERRMKEETRTCSVVCTNTLELGIDIGQLDLIVQINSTSSVMSFVQRLGRSGRRPGEPRTLQVYTSELAPDPREEFYQRLPFEMLKALAVTDLFLEGWIEPPRLARLPYHIVYHQLLSRVTERNGQTPMELVDHFLAAGVFPEILPDKYSQMIDHLVSIDHLEKMPEGELILGLTGEKIVRSRDFYAVFFTPPDWAVRTNTQTIGSIRPSPDLIPGACLILGGRLWKVTEILADRKEVLVIPAVEAQNVLFAGGGGPEIYPALARRMLEILGREDVPRYLDPQGQTTLTSARRLASQFRLQSQSVFETKAHWVLFLWTGRPSSQDDPIRPTKRGLGGELSRSALPMGAIGYKKKEIYPHYAKCWKE